MQITDHVPNLVGGITQQPPETRIKTAVEEMVNAYPSAIQGLNKRRGAQFVASLTSTALGTTSFHHTIDRDELEKYIVIVNSDGSVEVYDTQTGTSQPVTSDFRSAPYLAASDPSVSIRAVTAGDYTFIANRTKTVALDAGTDSTATAITHELGYNRFDHTNPTVPNGYVDAVYKVGLKIKYDRTLSNGSVETFEVDPIAELEASLPSMDYHGYNKRIEGIPFTVVSSGQQSEWKYPESGTTWQAPSSPFQVYARQYEGDGSTNYFMNVDNAIADDPAYALVDTEQSSSQVDADFTTKFKLYGTATVSDQPLITDSDNLSALYQTPVTPSTVSVTAYNFGTVEGYAVTLAKKNSNGSWATGAQVSYNDMLAARLQTFSKSLTDGDGLSFTFSISSATVDNEGKLSITTQINGSDTATYISSATETIGNQTFPALIYGVNESRGDPDREQSVFFSGDTTDGAKRSITLGHSRTLNDGSTEIFYKKYESTSNGQALANLISNTSSSTTQGPISATDADGNAFTVSFTETTYDGANDGITIRADAPFFITDVKQYASTSQTTLIEGAKTYASRTVTDFDDLPDRGSANEVVRISGQSGTQEDDYYVEWDGSQWVESIGFGEAENLGNETMPQVLIRNSDGTWTLRPHDWRGREVGDQYSNETPTFVNQQINDLFVFQGRLGICAGESIVLSEVDYFEQFYRSTCVQLEDDNRIDVQLNFGRVQKPHAALAVQDNLILFSDKGQFRMYSGSGVLTPKTATIIQIGDFETSTKVKPHEIGKSAFFTSEVGGFTVAREFFLGAATDDRLLSSDLTIQCPQYITGNARYIQASRDHKSIFVLSRDDPTSIYVYKFEYDGETKVQSAWCKWTLGVGTIESIGLFQNYLYIVSSLGTERELSKIDIRDQQDVPGTELMRLDLQVAPTLANTTYYAQGVSGNEEVAETQIAIPFDGTDLVECWDLTDGHTIPIERFTSSGNLILKGDYRTQVAAGKVVVGIPYTMDVKLSTFYRRAPRKPSGEIVVTDGRLTVNYINIAYSDTVAFTVETSSRGRATKTYKAGPKVGFVDVKYGEVPKTSGHLRVPVMTRNDNAEIRIKNDSPFASTILHIDWFGKHNPRARRV